jgi:cardiolipin synthase (CMP-forming)
VKGLVRHLPNFLTGLRLMAAPATAGLLVSGHFNAALGVFALAGLSDAADGYLAKRFGLGSELGRFLDPAADKALMLAVIVTLAALGEVPVWLAVVVVGRDAAIVLGLLLAAILRLPLAIEPLVIGKLTTALQVLYIAIHLASLAFGFSLSMVTPADALIVAAITLASWFSYGLVLLKAMQAMQGRDVSKA